MIFKVCRTLEAAIQKPNMPGKTSPEAMKTSPEAQEAMKTSPEAMKTSPEAPEEMQTGPEAMKTARRPRRQ